jgi:hypothetical protein
LRRPTLQQQPGATCLRCQWATKLLFQWAGAISTGPRPRGQGARRLLFPDVRCDHLMHAVACVYCEEPVTTSRGPGASHTVFITTGLRRFLLSYVGFHRKRCKTER